MYEVPSLRRFGTFAQLTLNGQETPDDGPPALGVAPGCNPNSSGAAGCGGTGETDRSVL